MKNPRRDALEYGMLLFLGTTAVIANGVLIYFKKTGELEKLDLKAPGRDFPAQQWLQSLPSSQNSSSTEKTDES
jgi:hypothetical protein